MTQADAKVFEELETKFENKLEMVYEVLREIKIENETLKAECESLRTNLNEWEAREEERRNKISEIFTETGA